MIPVFSPLWLLLVLAATVASAALAEAGLPLRSDPLAPFNARYDLERTGLHIGEAQLELTNDGDTYRYSLKLVPRGIAALLIDTRVDEESRFLLIDGRPRAHYYRYHRYGGRKERLVVQEFEWDDGGDGRVVNQINGDEWRLELPAGSFDKLLYQVAIMVDLARGSESMSYPIADGGTLKHYIMQVVATEPVTTPLGRFETRRLERIKTNSRRVTRMWCASRLGELPVRIEQTNKDEALSMVLTRLE